MSSRTAVSACHPEKWIYPEQRPRLARASSAPARRARGAAAARVGRSGTVSQRLPQLVTVGRGIEGRLCGGQAGCGGELRVAAMGWVGESGATGRGWGKAGGGKAGTSWQAVENFPLVV